MSTAELHDVVAAAVEIFIERGEPFKASQVLLVVRRFLPDQPDDATIRRAINDYASLGCFPASDEQRDVARIRTAEALTELVRTAEELGVEESEPVGEGIVRAMRARQLS